MEPTIQSGCLWKDWRKNMDKGTLEKVVESKPLIWTKGYSDGVVNPNTTTVHFPYNKVALPYAPTGNAYVELLEQKIVNLQKELKEAQETIPALVKQLTERISDGSSG